MCMFEIPVFKYISKLWTDRGYSLVTVLGLSELDAERNFFSDVRITGFRVDGWGCFFPWNHGELHGIPSLTNQG